jgi:nitroreductase
MTEWAPENIALADLLRRRRSCRGFRPDQVPRPIIERMLDLAQHSASWCNTQPWQVSVTSGAGTERFRRALMEEVRRRASEGFGEAPDFPFPVNYSGAYRDRRRKVAWQLYEQTGVIRGDRVGSAVQAMRNFQLFDAPHALIITSPRDLGVYGAIDCGLYIQALLLAAESLGLGIIAQAALAGHAEFIREYFDHGDDRMVVASCSFGYADKGHPANGFRAHREPTSSAVRWMEK